MLCCPTSSLRQRREEVQAFQNNNELVMQQIVLPLYLAMVAVVSNHEYCKEQVSLANK